MHPAIHWFAVPLLALVLPGLSPIASVPDGPALPGLSEPADTLPTQCLLAVSYTHLTLPTILRV